MRKLFLLSYVIYLIGCTSKMTYSKTELEMINMVEIKWIEKFGQDIKKYQPYVIVKNDSTWIIHGSLPKRFDGGVPYAVVDTVSMGIIEVYHTK